MVNGKGSGFWLELFSDDFFINLIELGSNWLYHKQTRQKILLDLFELTGKTEKNWYIMINWQKNTTYILLNDSAQPANHVPLNIMINFMKKILKKIWIIK